MGLWCVVVLFEGLRELHEKLFPRAVLKEDVVATDDVTLAGEGTVRLDSGAN